MELSFRTLSANKHGVQAVKHVTGHVSSGEILAVLGPKGCGKTSLLYALGAKTCLTSGHVILGGRSLDSRRQEVALVTQDYFFLPLLTIQETVQYEASLRLPSSMSSSDKAARVNNVIDVFDLKPFTISAVQFTVPAVQKRLAMACNILSDPTVLLVDEPYMSLTFEESLNIARNLQCLAEQSKKIVIIGADTLSSSLYSLCSRVVFLHLGEAYKGRRAKIALETGPDGPVSKVIFALRPSILDILCFTWSVERWKIIKEHLNIEEIYSGRADGLADKLQDVGLPRPSHISVVDHMLELLTSDDHKNDNSKHKQLLKAAQQWRHQSGHTPVSAARVATGDNRKDIQTMTVNMAKAYKKNGYSLAENSDQDEITLMVEPNIKEPSNSRPTSKYQTPFWNQVTVLTSRNFRNARRRILSPVPVLQNFYILVLCVLVWWRPDRAEENIMGTMGLFFFTTVQWAFFALLDAIFTFPKELRVVTRERDQGLYTAMSYCLSKSVSELPLAILQPCVYMCVMYWVANLNSTTAFFKSVAVVVVNVYTAQSIGLFVGVALTPPWTVSIMSLGLLSMMLIGGAFNSPPPWLQWGKYASIFYYGVQSLVSLEFTDASSIRCSKTGSMIPVCGVVDTATNTTTTHFRSEIILEMNQVTWPMWQYVVVLMSVMMVMRTLWYLVLRFYRRPPEW